MKHKDAYCIDLETKRPKIKLLPGDKIQKHLDNFGVTVAEELSDYDLKIFYKESDAEKYLKKYLITLKSLNNKAIKDNPKRIPAMLLKRRYLVQAIMGEKKQTYRHYDKKWKSGKLFNFYDQTYSMRVKLTKITKIDDQEYKYDYKLV